MFSSAGSYPHASVIMKTDGTCFFLEEYAGMSIFVRTWTFVRTMLNQKKKGAVMESFSIILPSPPFHPQGKKKSHREYAAHSKRVIILFQQPLDFTNIQTNLVEPVVLHHSTFHLLPLLLWPLPLCLMQASHCVFKQKAGYPF